MGRGITWKTIPGKLPPVPMYFICLKNVIIAIIPPSLDFNPGEEGKRRATGTLGEARVSMSAGYNIWNPQESRPCKDVLPRLMGPPPLRNKAPFPGCAAICSVLVSR